VTVELVKRPLGARFERVVASWPAVAREHLQVLGTEDDEIVVIVNREPAGGGLDHLRWHVSVSRRDRLPEWAEFAEIVHQVRPGVAFALPLPPKSWWINVHEFTLHAWEVKDEPLVRQWRLEARGDRPS